MCAPVQRANAPACNRVAWWPGWGGVGRGGGVGWSGALPVRAGVPRCITTPVGVARPSPFVPPPPPPCTNACPARCRQFQGSVQTFTKAVNTAPRKAEAYVGRAHVYLAQGQVWECVGMCRDVCVCGGGWAFRAHRVMGPHCHKRRVKRTTRQRRFAASAHAHIRTQRTRTYAHTLSRAHCHKRTTRKRRFAVFAHAHICARVLGNRASAGNGPGAVSVCCAYCAWPSAVNHRAVACADLSLGLIFAPLLFVAHVTWCLWGGGGSVRRP